MYIELGRKNYKRKNITSKNYPKIGIMGSTKFQEVKIQGYEPWEMGSEEGDNSSEYEFDTLRDYDSDNSDSMNFSMQTLETFDFEEKIREIANSSAK
jgi:hypothetical protein